MVKANDRDYNEKFQYAVSDHTAQYVGGGALFRARRGIQAFVESHEDKKLFLSAHLESTVPCAFSHTDLSSALTAWWTWEDDKVYSFSRIHASFTLVSCSCLKQSVKLGMVMHVCCPSPLRLRQDCCICKGRPCGLCMRQQAPRSWGGGETQNKIVFYLAYLVNGLNEYQNGNSKLVPNRTRGGGPEL